MRLRLTVLANLTAVALLPACSFPHRNLPPGTTLETISDMLGVSTPQEFAAFAEAWPSICGTADSAPVCLLAYEGRYESADLRPTRMALVRLPDEVVCFFFAGQPTDGSDFIIRVNPYRADLMLPTGLSGPLRSPTAPDAADFVRLCRDLT